jgi:hypothetical protein
MERDLKSGDNEQYVSSKIDPILFAISVIDKVSD